MREHDRAAVRRDVIEFRSAAAYGEVTVTAMEPAPPLVLENSIVQDPAPCGVTVIAMPCVDGDTKRARLRPAGNAPATGTETCTESGAAGEAGSACEPPAPPPHALSANATATL